LPGWPCLCIAGQAPHRTVSHKAGRGRPELQAPLAVAPGHQPGPQRQEQQGPVMCFTGNGWNPACKLPVPVWRPGEEKEGVFGYCIVQFHLMIKPP
jgi:hypothetical protein